MKYSISKILACVALIALAEIARCEDVREPASKRFSSEGVKEVPSFQQHVLPLMSRVGCNGRACHGSFQGQGGFRLSLFGYDFKADHEALTKGEVPRANSAAPAASKMLMKATMETAHKGGKRIEPGSWQYHLLLRWIEGGAKGVGADHKNFAKLHMEPEEIVFDAHGQMKQMKVVAEWQDGSKEDVTCLSRFQVNDDAVAEITPDGLLMAKGAGDTHVVAFYDNGVAVSPVLLPVSNKLGERYPKTPTPTKIDELVVAKLKKLGMIQSELANDNEFLRRVSLDMTGSLPTPEEIKKFVADKSPNKRAKKIDELLERPSFAAWWTTKFCDQTGNNPRQLDQVVAAEEGKEWYAWIYERVKNNVPYDELVAGIVMAKSRRDGQSYKDFAAEMSSYYHKDSKADFSKRETMPFYWQRRNLQKVEDKALAFSHDFLGVRLHCAQCHKHPFDQWTQQDFQSFQAFFSRVGNGIQPRDREQMKEVEKAAGLANVKGGDQRKAARAALDEGKAIPFREVFVTPLNKQAVAAGKGKKTKVAPAVRAITPKVLGGEAIVQEKYSDPREALMDWMRQEDNPYFARALVNRVWSNYFGKGIIDPPDDQNLANPPSNKELLDYLASEFIAHKFDMKWLHREITNSRAYQLTWKPNETNKLDERNFSHSVIRRLPAEVVYDVLNQSTSNSANIGTYAKNRLDRATSQTGGDVKKARQTNFALATFGKPKRETTCDCERSDEPNLLQTIFLRNDQEMLAMIDRKEGWIAEIATELKQPIVPIASGPPPQQKGKPGKAEAATKKADARIAKAVENSMSKKADAKKPNVSKKNEPARETPAQRIERLERRLKRAKEMDEKSEVERLTARLAEIRAQQKLVADKAKKAADQKVAEQKAKLARAASSPSVQPVALIREAYLRTVSRMPTEEEISVSKKYFAQAESSSAGLRDLLWALINTKEFVLNH